MKASGSKNMAHTYIVEVKDEMKICPPLLKRTHVTLLFAAYLMLSTPVSLDGMPDGSSSHSELFIRCTQYTIPVRMED